MAYAAVTGTKGAATQSGGGHGSGAGDGTTVSGDVHLAWDTTKITKLSDLKAVLLRMLLVVEGGMLKG